MRKLAGELRRRLAARVKAQREPLPPIKHVSGASVSPTRARLIKAAGLRHVTTAALTIRRQRRGRGYSYLRPDGSTIRDPEIIDRLNRLAVPPAYVDVLYAADPRAHLQAVGRDAAGRLQYRYHPEWEKVREQEKARRLMRLVRSLPRIRRSLTRHLSGAEPTRSYALAAVVELVSRSAIRAGGESYSRLNGTRGAATLLKSNVVVKGSAIRLSFRAKGGRDVEREFRCRRFAGAVAVLRELPGRRLFQYRDEGGAVRQVRRRDVNDFLAEIAGVKISLKDFRTLVASAAVLQELAGAEPAPSQRARRRQVLDAVRRAADKLANTPAICRRSYVHDTVIAAFEAGKLARYADRFKAARSPSKRERALAEVIAGA